MSENLVNTARGSVTQAEIDQADALALASQLIAIDAKEYDGQPLETVDARTLHHKLGVQTQFSHWFERRTTEYLFTDQIDYFGYVHLDTGPLYGTNEYIAKMAKTKKNHGPTIQIEYDITLDMAKELAMVEKNEIGQLIRRYFIDREKRYNNIVDIFIGDRRKDSRRFALEFFQHVSHVYGKKIPVNDKHNPMMRGFVNRYVYRCLPQEVRQRYNEINPLVNGRRKYPIHQLLTLDMDHGFLKKRLELIVDYCKGCGYGDSASFKRMINNYDKNSRQRIRLPRGQQLVLTPFSESQILLPLMAGEDVSYLR